MFFKKNKTRYTNDYYKSLDGEEYYRQLRTNIEFSSVHKKIHSVCVTSSRINEGKTVTSSNLALICASKDSNVLLVDCDLRKPSIHKVFKLSNVRGLSNLLLEDDFDPHDDVYFKKAKREKDDGYLYVLTAGSPVPNPQELLSSDKFSQLVANLRKSYDFIIFDCPPLLSVADAIPVSNVSDGTILVVSALDTKKSDAKLALTHLQRNGANVIGCVLNKVDVDTSGYYYYDY